MRPSDQIVPYGAPLSPIRFFQLLLSMSLRRSFPIKTKFSVRLRFQTSCTEPSVSHGITC